MSEVAYNFGGGPHGAGSGPTSFHKDLVSIIKQQDWSSGGTLLQQFPPSNRRPLQGFPNFSYTPVVGVGLSSWLGGSLKVVCDPPPKCTDGSTPSGYKPDGTPICSNTPKSYDYVIYVTSKFNLVLPNTGNSVGLIWTSDLSPVAAMQKFNDNKKYFDITQYLMTGNPSSNEKLSAYVKQQGNLATVYGFWKYLLGGTLEFLTYTTYGSKEQSILRDSQALAKDGKCSDPSSADGDNLYNQTMIQKWNGSAVMCPLKATLP
jgi:hypothetical protein